MLVLNTVDESEKQAMTINNQLLSQLLGVPVIPTVAIKKQGMKEIKENIGQARSGQQIQSSKKKWINWLTG